jgi:hypothetical protein
MITIIYVFLLLIVYKVERQVHFKLSHFRFFDIPLGMYRSVEKCHSNIPSIP